MGEVVNPHSTKLFTERERWICIYPAYINLKKTAAQGRRIAKSHCIENPTTNEIKDVLIASNFSVDIENKYYPREWNKDVLFKGRVRVHIKDTTTGNPINPDLPNKHSILLHLGEMIPRLKSRVQKGSATQSNISAAGPSGETSHTSNTRNINKKKNKGKR
ncbi:unnamed protein product [Gordionus sp. m RMFG-2023]|uniref:signal recognition particle 19 kDa protein-like n=1 Tax=Gordionus sp. m RMFG-2023 TaxID=3053472 RepID=UPI0030DE5D30